MRIERFHRRLYFIGKKIIGLKILFEHTGNSKIFAQKRYMKSAKKQQFLYVFFPKKQKIISIIKQ